MHDLEYYYIIDSLYKFSFIVIEVIITVQKNSRDLITSYNLKQSTNSKGDCWESAYVEISFHSIKVEAI
ncbi:hypothetical protein D2H50_15110 [Vibrio parahaemolyticus]|nr:hypothetical protein [Vibrio parahaemolyticus]EGR2350825.1 hypothetical protein [Vibrio parahaemolyticus]EGR3355896.1 hypothetical protein [Vibrio parahaemolyticus]ODZ77806.1 hypothetical protein BBM46_07395 [Vibrio parahaemolyticus]